jgi:hypothetical protein
LTRITPGDASSPHNPAVGTHENSDAASNRNLLERSSRILRRLLPFYIAALVLSAPLVLGLFAYGLAHAGDGAITQLIGLLAVLFLVAAVPPLALLWKGNGRAMVVLKVFGGGVMLAAGAGMFLLLKFWWLEPQWMKLRFRHAMNAIEVVGVTEEPLQLDGRVIGLKVVREVRLKRRIALEPYGTHVLGAIQHIVISPVNAPADAQSPFDMQVTSRLLAIDGAPSSATFDDLALTSARKLPAGLYQTEHIVLLAGLRGRDWPKSPCRDDELLARAAASLAKVSGYALAVRSVARLSLESRRGYDFRSVRSMPLSYRYEHSSWMRGVQQLPISSCKEEDEREDAARAAANRAEKERWYAEGDSRLTADENPLLQEICGNELDAVRARLARGTPTFNLSGVALDCTVTKPQLEMFGLVMPALYARTQERASYCSVVRTLHSRRALAYLDKLGSVGLPLVCTSVEDPPADYRREACRTNPAPHRCLANTFAGEHMWRAGLYPSDENGWVNRDVASRHDTLQWLQLLHTHHVPICQSLPDGTNLLQELVARSSPEVVAYLVKAGCDPHIQPPLDPSPEYVQFQDFSPALRWFMRTNGIAIYGDEYVAVDPSQGRAIARAMSELTASDINHASADSGMSLLHRLARYLPDRPELLRYLLAHGARLDVADAEGRSWFDKGYTQVLGRERATDVDQARLLSMLDQLSVTQLRELMSPKNSLSGEPGLPIEEYDFAPGRLTIYLCERGAKKCSR